MCPNGTSASLGASHPDDDGAHVRGHPNISVATVEHRAFASEAVASPAARARARSARGAKPPHTPLAGAALARCAWL